MLRLGFENAPCCPRSAVELAPGEFAPKLLLTVPRVRDHVYDVLVCQLCENRFLTLTWNPLYLLNASSGFVMLRNVSPDLLYTVISWPSSAVSRILSGPGSLRCTGS